MAEEISQRPGSSAIRCGACSVQMRRNRAAVPRGACRLRRCAMARALRTASSEWPARTVRNSATLRAWGLASPGSATGGAAGTPARCARSGSTGGKVSSAPRPSRRRRVSHRPIRLAGASGYVTGGVGGGSKGIGAPGRQRGQPSIPRPGCATPKPGPPSSLSSRSGAPWGGRVPRGRCPISGGSDRPCRHRCRWRCGPC